MKTLELTLVSLALLSGVAFGSRLGGHPGGHSHGRNPNRAQDPVALAASARRTNLVRQGRKLEVQGGIDFSNAILDQETGLKCIEKDIEVDTLDKEPILDCTHKMVEKCHYTYVTKFKPSQEQICQENFEKKCQITFKEQGFNETVRKCYKPVNKICDGSGPEECRTIFESSCTTKYIEKQPGKFVGDSQCEKLPIEVCGAGCTYEEGEEECHDKVVASVVKIPEEICDLNPQKTCRFTTKLVPSLTPQHECTIVPQETCFLKFTNPKPGKKPLKTKWCLDETAPTPGESYDESTALGAPLGPSGASQPSAGGAASAPAGGSNFAPSASGPAGTSSFAPSASGPSGTSSFAPSASGPAGTSSFAPSASGPSGTSSFAPSASGPSGTSSYSPNGGAGSQSGAQANGDNFGSGNDLDPFAVSYPDDSISPLPTPQSTPSAVNVVPSAEAPQSFYGAPIGSAADYDDAFSVDYSVDLAPAPAPAPAGDFQDQSQGQYASQQVEVALPASDFYGSPGRSGRTGFRG